MKKILLATFIFSALFGLANFSQASSKDNEKDHGNKKVSVTVISPNGGEVYTVGQQMNISFESKHTNSNMTARVYLIYTPDEISTPIASGPANGGNFNYAIPTQLETMTGPLPSGKFYKIKVNIIDNNQKIIASDLSDKKFTVKNNIN